MLAISYRLYRSLFTSRQAKASRARLSKKKLIPPRLVRWLVDEVNAEASVNYARDFVTNLTNWIGQRIIASLAVLLFFSFFFLRLKDRAGQISRIIVQDSIGNSRESANTRIVISTAALFSKQIQCPWRVIETQAGDLTQCETFRRFSKVFPHY